MEQDDAHLRTWIGNTETRQDRIDGERARALGATLDDGGRALKTGDPLPPLWHWLYFWPIVARSDLGGDGHPAVGGFLPPVGRARRMWAGSRVAFLKPLRLGERAERRSTITDVSAKTGRSGRLVFVSVRHEVSGPEGHAVTDEQDIVYREVTGAPSSAPPGRPAPADAAFAETVTPDPVLLFRYSALTFNAHRIHYDRPYASEVEGYPGLVVHGPLLATLMVGLAVRSWPERTIRSFRFRGQRPVLDLGPFRVCANPEDGALGLWVADGDGMLAMEGTAEFA